MLNQNKEIFDLHNITKWHEQGYTGKGIKIAVLDPSNSLYNYQKDIVYDPLKKLTYGDSKKGHIGQCCAVIQEVCPEAEIYALTVSNEAEKWILNNDIDICSCSYTGAFSMNKEFSNSDIIVFAAAGNRGNDSISALANQPWSMCVGAYSIYTGNMMNYSNYGEAMTCATCTNVSIKTNIGTIMQFDGTSCSTPLAAGMMALYKQRFGLKNWQEALNVIANNSKDICEYSKDIYSGYGLFILPDVEEEPMIIQMQIGNKEAYVNGEKVELLRAPEEQNGTTLVPVRFVAETLGCDVNYDSKTKIITITKGD